MFEFSDGDLMWEAEGYVMGLGWGGMKAYMRVYYMGSDVPEC